MPARDNSAAARSLARLRAAAERGDGEEQALNVVVKRSANRCRASRLVTQRPPRRIAARRTRWPDGDVAPSSIQRRTQLGETGRPLRPGGSRRAVCGRDRVDSLVRSITAGTPRYGIVVVATTRSGLHPVSPALHPVSPAISFCRRGKLPTYSAYRAIDATICCHFDLRLKVFRQLGEAGGGNLLDCRPDVSQHFFSQFLYFLVTLRLLEVTKVLLTLFDLFIKFVGFFGTAMFALIVLL